MGNQQINRRGFLQSASVLPAAGLLGGLPLAMTTNADEKPKAKVERLGIGAIGMRYQGSVITEKAHACTAMWLRLPMSTAMFANRPVRAFGSTPRIFEDYQDLLKRKDVDVVMIATPDHWHTKMLIDADAGGQRCLL